MESLLDYDIGPDVLSLVPKEICAKHRLLPLDKLGRILTGAMVDPLCNKTLLTTRSARMARYVLGSVTINS